METAYLDNAATTPPCQAAIDAVADAMRCFGNPSSLHSVGTDGAALLGNCRKTVAAALKADPSELIFTSGGTEADNIAVLGAAQALRRRGNRIVTTAVEHAAVLEPMRELERQGFEVVYLQPDKAGNVRLAQFEEAVTEKTILVSAMFVNNETGAFLPVRQLKALLARAGAPGVLHVDAVQAFGKYPLAPGPDGIDLMSVSSHKIHGPKGAGALYVRRGVRLCSPVFGGGQERGIRPGTEPLPAIAGFAAAVGEISDLPAREAAARAVWEQIAEGLKALEGIVIHSAPDASAYVLSFSVLGLRSETLLHFLEQRGVYVSSGSACAKGKASHVLTAMGLSPAERDSAIRVSLSRLNTPQDADRLIDGIRQAQQTLIHTKIK